MIGWVWDGWDRMRRRGRVGWIWIDAWIASTTIAARVDLTKTNGVFGSIDCVGRLKDEIIEVMTSGGQTFASSESIAFGATS